MVSTGWMAGSSRLSFDSDLADCVNTVITFYATSLSHLVGRAYKPPSLPFLARWWFDVSSTLFLFINYFRLTLCRIYRRTAVGSENTFRRWSRWLDRRGDNLPGGTVAALLYRLSPASSGI